VDVGYPEDRDRAEALVRGEVDPESDEVMQAAE
jgi:hypothetical protein